MAALLAVLLGCAAVWLSPNRLGMMGGLLALWASLLLCVPFSLKSSFDALYLGALSGLSLLVAVGGIFVFDAFRDLRC